MTKKTISFWFLSAVVFFVCLIIGGVIFSLCDSSPNRVYYTTYKDLMPLAIAIAAAWLGFCVQRRSAYLQQLRSIWTKLVDAVQTAIHYTRRSNCNQEEHLQALLKLATAIDEVRGVFCNLSEPHNGGLYPFEPLKDIYILGCPFC